MLLRVSIKFQLKRTVTAPGPVITPPCAVESPTRAAGKLLINILVLPVTITSGGPAQVHMFETVAAGKFKIKTFGTPGGKIGPPTWGSGPVNIGQMCISVTRAAGIGIDHTPFPLEIDYLSIKEGNYKCGKRPLGLDSGKLFGLNDASFFQNSVPLSTE